MKRTLYLIGGTLLLLIILLIGGNFYYLHTIKPTEVYPEDAYLDTVQNRKALIVVAHDDDAISCAGTISMLCSKGWQVRERCFFQQRGRYAQKDNFKNPLRKKWLKQAAVIQGMAGVDPVDLDLRYNMWAEAAYMPMPYSKFATAFKVDTLTQLIGNYIKKYRPSVIFTLDNVIGGYGNPDHVLISQLIVAYCKLHQNDPGFSIKKIYQPVFTPTSAEDIIGKLEVYLTAKKAYQCKGMPAPDVQVNIKPYAQQKKEVMTGYSTEQNSIRKMWPYYNWYPAGIYFGIFNREFFRVLEVAKL